MSVVGSDDSDGLMADLQELLDEQEEEANEEETGGSSPAAGGPALRADELQPKTLPPSAAPAEQEAAAAAAGSMPASGGGRRLEAGGGRSLNDELAAAAGRSEPAAETGGSQQPSSVKPLFEPATRAMPPAAGVSTALAAAEDKEEEDLSGWADVGQFIDLDKRPAAGGTSPSLAVQSVVRRFKDVVSGMDLKTADAVDVLQMVDLLASEADAAGTSLSQSLLVVRASEDLELRDETAAAIEICRAMA